MALTIPTLALSSGIELANPLLVISELNVNNNTSSNERLEINGAPGEGNAVSQGYKVITSNHGGQGCTYMVSVFASQDAFDEGKPPVDQVREGRNVKVFSLNLAEDVYTGITPREAAYTHLTEQTEFEAAHLVSEVLV
ncbi:hypothetical protein CXF86_18940 [Shewanella sp. GutCb]|uniref:hypothetical protein n=1 Tax=Shewanella sp. GutCb TaxID=2058315 RepID=UPI000C7E36CB|nr:hypothetical protein [Shewanella sp. GutCb]PKG73183.1 hypothetical protein CXF86_18940 [Shewanella sp. GutCb]